MPETKEQATKRLGLKNFDYALPQSWVDACYNRGFEVVPHFVWYYGDGTFEGTPYPLTEEGHVILRKLALYVR